MHVVCAVVYTVSIGLHIHYYNNRLNRETKTLRNDATHLHFAEGLTTKLLCETFDVEHLSGTTKR